MNTLSAPSVKEGMKQLPLALALSAILPVLPLAAPGASAWETERVSRTLELALGGTLQLRTFSGRVDITPIDRNEVVIDAVRRGTRHRLDRVKLEIRAEGSTIVVDANARDSSSWAGGWFSKGHGSAVETDLNIKVPRRTNIQLNAFSAEVTIEGVEGSHRIHGFSSRIRLTDVSGPVLAHTFSGPVEIRESSWPDGQTFTIDTFSGSITVHVPDGARGTVSFNSFSGHLSSDILTVVHRHSRRSLTAELGTSPGGGSLRFKTFSGSVRIDR
jgi:hypothetical protein